MELVIQVARARLKYDPETETYGAGFAVSDAIGVVTVTDFHEYDAPNPEDRYAHAVITAIGPAPKRTDDDEDEAPQELPDVASDSIVVPPKRRNATRKTST